MQNRLEFHVLRVLRDSAIARMIDVPRLDGLDSIDKLPSHYPASVNAVAGMLSESSSVGTMFELSVILVCLSRPHGIPVFIEFFLG